MATELSPWEKWQREKARLAAGESQNDATVNPIITDKSSVYKKPGEYCPHPPELVGVMTGKNIGTVKICGACGQIIAEGISKPAEDREEDADNEELLRMPRRENLLGLEINREDNNTVSDDDNKDEEEGYVK